jgi:hypothetical protein
MRKTKCERGDHALVEAARTQLRRGNKLICVCAHCRQQGRTRINHTSSCCFAAPKPKPWHPTKNPISRGLRFALIAACLIGTAQAEPRHRDRNYIIRRQQAGSVSGVPTTRRIRGGHREIDIYRNGLMFEGDNVIGIQPRR